MCKQVNNSEHKQKENAKCPYCSLFLKGSNIPNSLRIKINHFWLRGFVKMSANYKLVWINFREMPSFEHDL